MKKLIVVVIVVIVALSLNFLLTKNHLNDIYLKGQLIEYELADTNDERVKGLSGRKILPSNQGMLFNFYKSGYHGIWMKDMNFAIDIIWFDRDFIIVDIAKNISPDTYPESFKPKQPAWYVLEVNAGFSDKYNIEIGDFAEFPNSST